MDLEVDSESNSAIRHGEQGSVSSLNRSPSIARLVSAVSKAQGEIVGAVSQCAYTRSVIDASRCPS